MERDDKHEREHRRECEHDGGDASQPQVGRLDPVVHAISPMSAERAMSERHACARRTIANALRDRRALRQRNADIQIQGKELGP